jgi:CDGSH-type Zn-finger protein
MPEVRIRTRENGPFLVEGPIELIDAEGNVFTIPTEKPAVALCRCGGSKNKPFCDGSHKAIGFASAEKAR